MTERIWMCGKEIRRLNSRMMYVGDLHKEGVLECESCV